MSTSFNDPNLHAISYNLDINRSSSNYQEGQYILTLYLRSGITIIHHQAHQMNGNLIVALDLVTQNTYSTLSNNQNTSSHTINLGTGPSNPSQMPQLAVNFIEFQNNENISMVDISHNLDNPVNPNPNLGIAGRKKPRPVIFSPTPTKISIRKWIKKIITLVRNFIRKIFK